MSFTNSDLLVLVILSVLALSALISIRLVFRKGDKKIEIFKFNKTSGENSPIMGENASWSKNDKEE